MGSARADCVQKSGAGELSWVCSRSKRRAVEFLDEKGIDSGDRGVAAFDSLTDACRNGDAEAVIITGPNALHREAAGEAIQAGLHVFLEYPPAVLPEEGEALMSLAREAGVTYAVGLTHRHGGRHRAVAERCGGGTSLGLPRIYQHVFCSGNPISRWYDKEELSGGMFVSSLYHFMDEALDYFGDPDSVTASYYSDTKDDGTIRADSGAIQLAFPSGCTAQIAYSRGMKEPGIGTRKSIIFDNGYIVEDQDGIRILTSDGIQELEYEDVDALQVETDAFIAGAGTGGGIADSVYQAQRTLIVADAARKQVTD
jgi:predicted dehydrogenase